MGNVAIISIKFKKPTCEVGGVDRRDGSMREWRRDGEKLTCEVGGSERAKSGKCDEGKMRERRMNGEKLTCEVGGYEMRL